MEKSKVTNIMDFKYEKIALKFLELKKSNPSGAAKYAREAVPEGDWDILSKYIQAEITRRSKIT